MRKQCIGIVLLELFLVLIFFGCDKKPLYSSVEGHWQLVKFTTLKDNNTVYCNRLFYGITRMVTEISEKQGPKGYGSYVARTEYLDNGTKLVLKDFKVYGYNTDKGVSATIKQLKPFGINNPNKTIFNILKSTDDLLILESDYANLILKKF